MKWEALGNECGHGGAKPYVSISFFDNSLSSLDIHARTVPDNRTRIQPPRMLAYTSYFISGVADMDVIYFSAFAVRPSSTLLQDSMATGSQERTPSPSDPNVTSNRVDPDPFVGSVQDGPTASHVISCPIPRRSQSHRKRYSTTDVRGTPYRTGSYLSRPPTRRVLWYQMSNLYSS